MTKHEPGTDRVLWEGPDSHLVFRLAQLQLLLIEADTGGYVISSVDRLAYYDFFAANPHSMLDGEDETRDAHDRLSLRLAGFNEGQLSYSAIGHRFANRRGRIQHDLASLVARGLAKVEPDRYAITEIGRTLGEHLSTVYADAYRAAAAIALSRLVRLSNRKLTEKTEQWLGKSWLLLDFLDDVKDVEPLNLQNQLDA